MTSSTARWAEHWTAVLSDYQAARWLPTIVAGVLTDGALEWSGSAGASTTVDTQYRIGSITKTMTGILVMQCRDEGLLDLDDPLGRFVPESGYRSARLRELLAHTSGMQSEPVGTWWERSPGVAIDELVTANDASGAVFAPGSTYHYSNLGFALLGEVVARVRGAGWQDVLAERLLAPLGLSRTSYLPESPFAAGFSVHPLRGTLTDEPVTDTGAMAPAGQLWSTVGDLARFAAFLRSGDPGILRRSSLAEMQVPVRADYGLATLVTPYDDGVLVGHLGSMPGFQACVLVDPESGAGVIALTNGTTGFTGTELAARLLGRSTPGAADPWRPTVTVPEWAEELLGYWHWGNSAFQVRWCRNRLEFFDLARGTLAEQFVQRGEQIVGVSGYHAGETLRVHRRGEVVSHLECATFIYTQTPYDPSAPIPGGHPPPR